MILQDFVLSTTLKKYDVLHFLKIEIYPNQKFRASETAKMVFFFNFSFLQNWFHVKSQRQKNACGKMKNSVSRKIFRVINTLVTSLVKHYFHEIFAKIRQINSLVKTLLSRNFCQKCVILNRSNFHTVTGGSLSEKGH